MGKPRIVHYINQFFAQIGGEEKADHKPEKRDGFVGPGQAISAALGETGEVVGTVICGDSYFNENLESASAEVLQMIKSFSPDIVVVGPGFNAGRYGMACGTISKAVSEKLGVPAVTAMYDENPGVDSFRKDVYILKTGSSAADMRKAAPSLAAFALKLGKKKRR